MHRKVAQTVTLRSHAVQLPVRYVSHVEGLERTQQCLCRHLGHDPAARRVTRCLGLGITGVSRSLALSLTPISLSGGCNGGRGLRLQSVIESRTPLPRSLMLRSSLERYVLGSLGNLSDRRGRILALHCNLSGRRSLSLTRVDRQVKIDHRQIHRVRQRTLRLLHGGRRRLGS